VRHRPRRLRLSLPPNFLLDCLSSDRRTRLRGIALPVSPLPSKPTPWSQPTSDYLVTYSSPQASHRDHPSGWQQAELLLGDFVRRSAPASKEGKTSARPRRRRTEQVPTCEELSLQCCSPQEQCSIANVATGMDVTTSATSAMVQMGVESSDELPPGGRVSITSLIIRWRRTHLPEGLFCVRQVFWSWAQPLFGRYM